jgi:CBS domain-containing protein
LQITAIMTRQVRSCTAEDSLKVAAQLMWDFDCGAVPVVDSAARVVGMVTDRDICMAAHFRGQLLGDVLVGEIMSTQVYTCFPEQGVAEAERLMKEKQIRRIPVIDHDRRLVGILSLADLAKTMRAQPPSSTHELNLAAVGDTLAHIAEPRDGRSHAAQ